jgi:hypothetical protein
MIFWSLCAFIWFKNIEKMLLQMTSGFLQLELGLYLLTVEGYGGSTVQKSGYNRAFL